jgi:alkanesulfonate monooxygenase SsuD/methylene tetrahydromethanopterin reductase-like flavin-dependent oxidoreductase (luciferase family)
MDRIGSSRGWAPYTKAQYDGGRNRDGALFIGSPAEVSDKISYMKDIFGITRFVGHMDVGDPDHNLMMKSIELFGQEVLPKVKSL